MRNVNLNVKRGETIGIIGKNGSGKSTLLKLILGMNPLKIGTISVLGKKPSQSLTKIGYVPQNTNINIDFPIKVIEVVLMGHIEGKRPLFGMENMKYSVPWEH